MEVYLSEESMDLDEIKLSPIEYFEKTEAYLNTLEFYISLYEIKNLEKENQINHLINYKNELLQILDVYKNDKNLLNENKYYEDLYNDLNNKLLILKNTLNQQNKLNQIKKRLPNNLQSWKRLKLTR